MWIGEIPEEVGFSGVVALVVELRWAGEPGETGGVILVGSDVVVSHAEPDLWDCQCQNLQDVGVFRVSWYAILWQVLDPVEGAEAIVVY